MSERLLPLTPALAAYVQAHGARETPVQARLRRETARLPLAVMQISPDQGALMALLAELIGAKRYLEVGVFTGYSALWVALALPADGHVTALDISEEWTAVARRYWAEAGVADRIELRLGDAVEALDRLLAEGQADSYDFAFLDAEKTQYREYYERALRLVRPGGLIAIDNVLQFGAVLDPSAAGAAAEVVDALNAEIVRDSRVAVAMLPVGDGLTLCRRRA